MAVKKTEPWVMPKIQDVGRFFGIDQSSLKTWRQDGMPGSRGHWDLAEITRWRIDRNRDDGQYSDPLDQYRHSRAQLASLDLAERQRELVRLDVIRPWLHQIGVIWRQCGDRMQKEYGPGVIEEINEAMEEAARLIDEGYDSTNTDRTDGEMSAGPDAPE